MKKVNKLFMLALGFVAGCLSGAFIRLGFEMVNGRPVSIGGEALILPLVIILICFGFALGSAFKAQVDFLRAYDRGFKDGCLQGQEIEPPEKAQGL